MATAPLPTPERAAVYARLVTDHHTGIRKFKSVAAFHAAYLEQGGTPRKKSVGKDRLFAGVPIGRKRNRVSKAKCAASAAAACKGKAGWERRCTLVPSESKNNRHGLNGQCSRAADCLNLMLSHRERGGGYAHQGLRNGPGSSNEGRTQIREDRRPPPNSEACDAQWVWVRRMIWTQNASRRPLGSSLSRAAAWDGIA